MNNAPPLPPFSPLYETLPPLNRQRVVPPSHPDEPMTANTANTANVSTPPRYYPTPRPEVRGSRNGYEIRTEMLALATDWLQFHYRARVQELERQHQRDGTVPAAPLPVLPSVDEVLSTAMKFYNFVTEHNKR